MPSVQNVSLTAPSDYSTEALSIERRRKLAEALQNQSVQPLESQTAGGWVIPTSPWQGMAKLAQAFTGAIGQRKADESERALAAKYRNDLSDVIRRGAEASAGKPAQTIQPDPQEAQQSADQGTPQVGPAAQPAQAPDPNTAASIYMEHPATQAIGMQMAQQAAQRQALMNAFKAQAPQNGNPMVPGGASSVMAGSGSTPASGAPPQMGFGGPAGGTPMEVWLQIDPTGKLYAEALAKDRITPYQNAQLAQSDRHFSGISGNTQATLGESQRHNKATEGQAGLTLAETSRHHGALEGDPGTIETTAKAIAEGKLAPLSGFALARPMAQNIMARVVQLNPDFDPTAFQTQQKAEKDFATGKQGNTVRSFNVALYHLDSLDKLADALHNGNTQLINKLSNTIATQTGGTAPTNFAAAKKLVGDEIVKAIVGSGGGVSDREEAAKTIASANSPAQLKGVINTYKELMNGQLKGLHTQYEATTKKKDFAEKYLSPEVRSMIGAQQPSNAELEAALKKYGG